MSDLGKLLVMGGLVMTGIGLLLWTGVGRGWLGRLPGDIHIEKAGFSFYFPVVTCVLLSVGLSLVVWLIRK